MKERVKAIVKDLVGVMVILMAIGCCSASVADVDFDKKIHSINIPATNAASALNELAFQTGAVLLFPYQEAKAQQANAVVGDYTLKQAMAILLKDSGLVSSLTKDGAIKISVYGNQRLKKSEERTAMNTKKTLLAATIGFFMGSGVQGVVAQEDVGGQEENGWLLEEVVVTAQKREESLQDTPISISVLSKDTIGNRGLVDMKDYLATIPGASYIEKGATDKRVVLRGLSLGPFDKQSTTGVYLGDMPISSSASDVFNINLVDIERIEVVKGPQGTLYGSSGLGGIVRNIPVSPNLRQTEGSLKVDASTQDESDDRNYSVVGVINMPLVTDRLALRLAAYRFKNAGYIDILSSPEEEAIAASTGGKSIVKNDTGGDSSKGVRATLLWQPTSELELNFVHGIQENDIDGRLDLNISSEEYEISVLNREPSESSETSYSNLLIKYDFGWAELSSSSSVLNNEGDNNSSFFSAFPDTFLGPLDSQGFFDTELKSQEIRLASDLSGPWQYLAGVFYEEAQIETLVMASWIGNISANPFGAEVLENTLTKQDYKQNALFGEASYRFSEEWQLTMGGRHFKYERTDTYKGLNNAIFNGPNNVLETNESGNTYKATMAFTPNEDTSAYAQWSEGFRLGRGQSLPPEDLCDVDNDGMLDFDTGGILTTRIESDTTENVELGLKLSLLNRSLTINTALFRTDWDNIPFLIQPQGNTTCTIGITNNVGSARSEGIEFEAGYLFDEWQINLSASYIDSKWTKALSSVQEGERLVYVPRTNANLGLQYSFSLGKHSAFIRTDIGYVGEYETAGSNLTFSTAGDYVDFNLRLHIDLSQWSLDIYANNLLGNDDLLVQTTGGSNGGVGARAIPRRLGLAISYNF